MRSHLHDIISVTLINLQHCKEHILNIKGMKKAENRSFFLDMEEKESVWVASLCLTFLTPPSRMQSSYYQILQA